jgi:uncharacterized membrane protein
MEILIWVLGFVLLFIGLFLVLFTEKFLSYDSKRLPNFWDPHGIDIVLLNWKSRRSITLIMGIIFLLGSIVVFLSIYIASQAKIA